MDDATIIGIYCPKVVDLNLLCLLLLSASQQTQQSDNNNSDNQHRTEHLTSTTQFLDVIVTDLSGVFEILACHSSFWKGEDGTSAL